MRQPDYWLLAAGFARAGLWVFCAHYMLQLGSKVGAVGFTVIATNAAIFAFDNAHIEVEPWQKDVAAWTSTVAAVMVATALHRLYRPSADVASSPDSPPLRRGPGQGEKQWQPRSTARSSSAT